MIDDKESDQSSDIVSSRSESEGEHLAETLQKNMTFDQRRAYRLSMMNTFGAKEGGLFSGSDSQRQSVAAPVLPALRMKKIDIETIYP